MSDELKDNLVECLRIIAYPSVYKKDIEAAADEIERLRWENENLADSVEICEIIIAKFKEVMNEINNKTVDFHELGPFDENEALRRVMEIYHLSLLKEVKPNEY